MSFSQGRYGVEYRKVESETHRLRTLVLVSLAAVGVAFTCYKISRWRANRKEKTPVVIAPPLPPPPKPDRPPRSLNMPPEVRPLVRELQETAGARPQQDQIVICRYIEAERQDDLRNAIDAIKKLYDRPSMADLSDPLMRRLGDLNLQLLLSGKQTPWTKTVTVRRGDGCERLAREHRTTLSALRKLNPKTNWDKLKPGDTVMVLEFPNAVLVIHKQTGTADLSLHNKLFFRRYYLSADKNAKCTLYPIASEAGETLHARFKELGLRIAPPDREELEMFLGPGSRIVVQE